MQEKNLATSIEGTVTQVNDAGDLITDISVEMIESAPRDQSVSVSFGPHETLGIFDKDHTEPESTLIALVGPSGFLEIGIVGVSIHEMLQVGVGEKIVVKW
jgi:S-adenosylmethionine hydrolase